MSVLRLQTLEPVTAPGTVAVMSMTSSLADCCNKPDESAGTFTAA